MTDVALNEQLDHLDMAWYLDREGIDYKTAMGHRGEQLNLRECPVCGGDKWKVYLNAENGLGNCFSGSCEETFNKFKFIKAHLGGARFPAVKKHVEVAAREQGWMPRRKIVAIADIEKKLSGLPASFAIPVDGKNLAYLAGRGIDREIAEAFALRYCYDGKYLADYDGKPYWQDFSERVIIPVFDLDGELVTFQGRDITDKAEKKYKFPVGVPGTARFLYNGHNAMGAKEIVICEGAFDVIAAHLAFDTHAEFRHIAAVGTFGKSLTMRSGDGKSCQLNQLARLVKGGVEMITFMWDGEKKALKDAIKTALALTAALRVKTRVALLPADKDPAEVDAAIVRKAYLEAAFVDRKTASRLLLSKPYG